MTDSKRSTLTRCAVTVILFAGAVVFMPHVLMGCVGSGLLHFDGPRPVILNGLRMCGRRATPLMIAYLREHMYSREVIYLRKILKQQGTYAQTELYEAIERESSCRERVSLIDTLQRTFGDLRHINVWFPCINHGKVRCSELDRSLSYVGEVIPPVCTMGTYNEHFVTWYKNKEKRKEVPPAEFIRDSSGSRKRRR